jgi:peptidylprolyl isomerase
MSTAEIAHLPEFKISARSGPPPRRLIVHDVRKGSGAVMKRGDGILVDWAETAYGEALKAPPKREGQPERLPFDGILEGWEEGLPGMKVGGRRELIVPPSLGDLPVTMVYQVDLLAVEPRL